MSQAHLSSLALLAYLRLRVPTNAPFELKPSPGRGWGAFSTKRIERGAVILREKPLFIIQKPPTEIQEEDIYRAFQRLVHDDKQQFLCLMASDSPSSSPMAGILAENCFNLPLAMGAPALGLYILLSRFNHSCVPNAKVPSSGSDILTIFATKDIAVGEEITFCYNPGFEFRIRNDRHRALCFVCDCKACLIRSPFQKLSDMRRTLMRGLQYLMVGVDLDGHRQSHASPIIFDSKLKDVAEAFSIPVSARLIYKLLVMFLLEEEGLLDYLSIRRKNTDILKIAGLFRTASNARIASLAVVQSTWLEKFCMASRLYGRKDTADQIISKNLQDISSSRRRP
ncbi:hypothetical protein FQN57_001577 [Myotisia sp. PD_48]|nr:hypothetical protein FQN57_001577 [Myotisia sp. PD_48]